MSLRWMSVARSRQIFLRQSGRFPWQLRQSYLIFASRGNWGNHIWYLLISAGQRISRSSLIVEDLQIFKFYMVARATVQLMVPLLQLLQLILLILLTYLLIVLLLITAILVILTFEIFLDRGQRAIHGLLCTCQIRALIKTLIINVQKQYQWYHHCSMPDPCSD